MLCVFVREEYTRVLCMYVKHTIHEMRDMTLTLTQGIMNNFVSAVFFFFQLWAACWTGRQTFNGLASHLASQAGRQAGRHSTFYFAMLGVSEDLHYYVLTCDRPDIIRQELVTISSVVLVSSGQARD